MAIQFGDNINYKGGKPLDSRSVFPTIAAMAAYPEKYLPPVFLCQNEEDGCLYQYNAGNEVDASTGKWRKFESGGMLKQVEVFPDDAVEGDIYQYVGEDTDEYVNGHVYRYTHKVETTTYSAYEFEEGGYYTYIRFDDDTVYESKEGGDSKAESVDDLVKKSYKIKSIEGDKIVLDDGWDSVFVKCEADDLSSTTEASFWCDANPCLRQVDLNDANFIPVANQVVQHVGRSNSNFSNGYSYRYLKTEQKYYLFINSSDPTDIIYYAAETYDAEPTDTTNWSQLFVKDENGNFVHCSYNIKSFTASGMYSCFLLQNRKRYYISYNESTEDGNYETVPYTKWETVYTSDAKVSKESGNGVTLKSDGLYVKTDYIKTIDGMSYIGSYFNNKTKLIYQYSNETKDSDSLDLTGENTYGSIKVGQVAKIKSYRTIKAYVAEGSHTMMPEVIYVSDNFDNKHLFGVSQNKLNSLSGWEYESIVDNVLTVKTADYKYNYDSSKNIKYPVWEVTSGGGVAESVTYSNDAKTDWGNVKEALDGLISKVYYVAPGITSFTMTPPATDYEVGQSVASLDFAWAYNKEVTTQSLTDATLELADRSATIAGPFTTSKTFTLTCGDGEKTATASKAISFKNKVYWGSSALPGTFDSAFVLGLSDKQFATAKKGSYTVTVADGEYGFIAYPKSFGKIGSVYIGGFETTVEDCGELSFTNASGGVVDYYICRTGRSGLGKITMEVK